MSDTIKSFCDCVQQEAFREMRNFAAGLRGPDCQLSVAVQEILSAPEANLTWAESLESALTVLDRCIGESGAALSQGDETISLRWLGISSLIRSQVRVCCESDRRDYIRRAKDLFDQAWSEAGKHFKTDWTPSTGVDSQEAKSGDQEIHAKWQSALNPWTPGSWMAWDVLCQMNRSQPSVVEKTNVLFGRVVGHVMKLVVELLPGPAKLVTPNWWQLGLTAFPANGSEQYFLGAIQRAMTLAAPPDRAVRVRWHLESIDPSTWKLPLEGRSGEAAAACAVMAAHELLQETEERKDKSISLQPVLDQNTALTAMIGNGGASDFLDWPLLPVDHDTLRAKSAAAQKQGIDVIGVAATQSLQGLVMPKGLRPEPVASVGEALDLLRAVNRDFDRYKSYVRSLFEYQEEETPVDK